MDTVTVKMIRKDSVGNIIKAADVHLNEVRGFQQAGWIIDKAASKTMPQVASPANSQPASTAPKAPAALKSPAASATSSAAPKAPAAAPIPQPPKKAAPVSPRRPVKRART